MRAIQVVAALVALWPYALQAQTATSPDSVLRAFLAAVAEQRWIDAGRFVEPARVERARRDALRHARDPGVVRSVEDHLRDQPEMPRAVAEWFVRQAERSRQLHDLGIAETFADVTDTLTLRRLSPDEAAARYVQANDPGYKLRLSYRWAPGCENVALSDADVGQFFPRYEILATVVRGDTAWIVRRDTSRDGPHSGGGPGIATVYRVSNRWYVDLDTAILGSPYMTAFVVRCDTTQQRRREP